MKASHPPSIVGGHELSIYPSLTPGGLQAVVGSVELPGAYPTLVVTDFLRHTLPEFLFGLTKRLCSL